MTTEKEYDRIDARLAELYSPYERAVWWASPHPLLNGERALYVLAAGRQQEIDRILDQLEAGAYI